MVRAHAGAGETAVSQLLHGEAFAVLDISAGWAWGYCEHDHYVGYVEAATLGAMSAPTHIVTAPLALAFARPDIKATVVGTWPIGSRLAATPDAGFLNDGSGWLHPRHLSSLSAVERDPVAVAERLLGMPYLWGGRGGGGIDCSGLVQLSLGLAGIAAPRDTDQQRAALGTDVANDAPLQRGDLLFFPGHVGLMVDEQRIVHANAHWMAVTIEPLADVVARLAPDHDQPVLARRRLA